MQVSVVLCTHTLERYEYLTDAAESVLTGTYDDLELVCVSDGNEAVYERMQEDYGDHPTVVTDCLDENSGLLTARNHGAELASGDVVAFLDDDAIACEAWLELLVDAYREHDALAVGGRMTPRWEAPDGEPGILPEEFYWLVGVTHRGFGPDGDPGEPGWVRNTMGSNISFRAEVFAELGGFDVDIGGRKGDNHLQGGESELCARLRAEYDQRVWYVPEATVEHRIFEYRTEPDWLLERAFWQGYSKRGMERFVPESTGAEGEFLGDLLGEFVPDRLRGLVLRPSAAAALQLLFLFVFTGAVGTGYLYGIVKWG
ncbi:glucosyl-dolichyl phosphate glucuronosyltransferase [Haloglomus halophilum]|uniref:glucosyl-dolichyl phosphate glucuronosyltransferase n=1 Tax=Haloglomus halophilum TaxID=2962672 RepID=UPI0020CA03C9|nr:glucosyl-dolichyl phosphate glucuronosyltransferase [Haloglomus halophilum]